MAGSVISPATRAAEWTAVPGPLMTRWAADVSPANALPEYPRPQMVRPRWQTLNGLWDYALTDQSAAAPNPFDGPILVPFPIESPLSGVRKALAPDRRLWYRRTFTVPADWRGGRVLLHFGAVDFEAAVSVNGKPVGSHRGGYDAFTLDITDALRPEGEQEVIVSVLDPTDAGPQLRGKQALHPAGAAYTASSGIWQTVWIEPVGASSVAVLKMVPDLKTGALRLTVEGSIAPAPLRIEVEAFDGETPVAKAAGTLGGEITPAVRENLVDFYQATATFASATLDVPIKNPKLWSPDRPFLYGLTVTLTDGEGKTLDSVKSYFGMRSVAVGTDADGHARLMLNGKPVLLAGVLDQGFWPDGVYTAPTDAALKFDVEAMKTLGLNAVRKHVKIEPDRWYYWCDTLGLLVLQDLPSGEGAGDPKTDRILNPAAAAENQAEFGRLITQRFNHPSIVAWVMFNEGWGQFDTLRIAAWAKGLDPTRLIDEASGFPHHGGGDVIDVHGGIPPTAPNQIGLDTESMGIGLFVPGHMWPGDLWGTVSYDPETGEAAPGREPMNDASKAWFTRQVRAFFKALHENAPRTGHSGDFKVQLTDVEIESNGLLTYDRAVWKVDPAPIAAAARGEPLPAAMSELAGPGEWAYTTDAPPADWASPSFDAGAWRRGAQPFGAGYGGLTTEWNTPDIWLRREFDLSSVPKHPMLRIRHDEAVHVYVNGALAATDSGHIDAPDDFPLSPTSQKALKAGRNVIAVRCHQTVGGQLVDVRLIELKH